MGRKRMSEGGGPKRRMQIDMTQITREREEEEAAEQAANEANKEEKKGNPLLHLLGGEYEDDERETSKLGNKAPSNSGNATSNSGDVVDPAIDKQLDSFLQELGQITGGENNGEKKASGGGGVGEKEAGGEKGEKEEKGEKGGEAAGGVWQAILDSESNEYYYWNTVTDEVTWDMPAEFKQQKQQTQQNEEKEREKKEKEKETELAKEKEKETELAKEKEKEKEELKPTETITETTTEKENTKEITKQEIEKDATKETTNEGAGVKRMAEMEEEEHVSKKLKIENESPPTKQEQKQDVNSPHQNSKDNDEITAILEQHHSEMMQNDEKGNEKEDKLQRELETAILAISGKFKTYDVEATEIFDNAVDSMDIDPEILMERRELTQLKIEFETRVVDWKEGALHPMYLHNKLQVLLATLDKTKLRPSKFETWNLLPVGWTRLADPSGSGTYFANVITNETSWTWPPETQTQTTTTTPTASSPTPSSSSSSTYSSAPVTYSAPPTSSSAPSSSSTPPPPSSSSTTIYSSAPVRYNVGSDEISETPFPPPSPPPPPPPDSPPPPPDSSSPSSSSTKDPNKKKVKVSSAVKPAKMNTVFAKWASARNELVGKKEEKEEEEEEDAETLEMKKKAEIEQWRTEQLKTGEAESNANFVPVAVDWRERVERARRIAANKDK